MPRISLFFCSNFRISREPGRCSGPLSCGAQRDKPAQALPYSIACGSSGARFLGVRGAAVAALPAPTRPTFSAGTGHALAGSGRRESSTLSGAASAAAAAALSAQAAASAATCAASASTAAASASSAASASAVSRPASDGFDALCCCASSNLRILSAVSRSRRCAAASFGFHFRRYGLSPRTPWQRLSLLGELLAAGEARPPAKPSKRSRRVGVTKPVVAAGFDATEAPPAWPPAAAVLPTAPEDGGRSEASAVTIAGGRGARDRTLAHISPRGDLLGVLLPRGVVLPLPGSIVLSSCAAALG
mmetsp:Transcript_103464/g.183497  ORF Transcript_103464/g.183497 Transcript_103464/m.183497 type:complete len:303 (-) Transcript_103464:1128-2036(-)